MSIKRFYIVAFVLLFTLVSCSAIFNKTPDEQSFQQRLAVFPRHGLPLEQPATVYWDDHLIPFIDAQTDADAAFLLGMVHAHLRLGQMTVFLRAAQGRLAESAGPLAASIDQTIRIMNFGAAVEQMEADLPEATKSWLRRYVEGVNFYQHSLKELPPEFGVLNIQPETWTPRDILLIGRLASADVNWFNWFQWLKLQDKPYVQKLWNRFVDLGFSATPSFSGAGSILNSSLFAGKSGSNALVVAGSRSADGSALMASDPHLGLQLPNLWLIAGYRSPSFHVVGLMLPGVPMVLVGRNPAISWSGTNMRSASSDLYQLSEAQLREASAEKSTIKVRWWFDKEITIRKTAFGPVLSDAPLLKAKEGQEFAMHWVGHSPSDEFSAFLNLNRSQNWDDFRQAFDSYAVSGQNFLYADTAGHIGMVLAVRIPRRAQERPNSFILDADNPGHQWQGLVSASELPHAFDPEPGFIASANNRPVEYHPPLGFFFSADDRIERMTHLLGQKDRVDLDYLKMVQQDVVVPSALAVRDLFLEQIHHFNLTTDKNSAELLQVLQNWDGGYDIEARGPVAFQLLCYHFISGYYNQVYDQEVADIMLSTEHVNTFLRQDLITGDSTLVKTQLQKALTESVDDFSQFANWGELHRLQLSHLLGRVPLIGGRYRFGEFPADGAYNSLMKTAHTISNKSHQTFYGANARFITRMIDADENYFVLLGGQDGWINSDNFIDQVPLWRAGQYIQVPLRLETIRRQFRHQMDFAGQQ